MRLYDHPTYGNERPGPGGHVVAQTQAWGGLGHWPSASKPLSTSPKVVEDIVAKQPVSTLIQTGVQGIGKLPAVATESAPTSDAPAASRFAPTRPGVAIPVVADQPFQLGAPPVQHIPAARQFKPSPMWLATASADDQPFRLSGYGQEGTAWHTMTATFKNHPLLWGGVAVALGCCLWKKLF